MDSAMIESANGLPLVFDTYEKYNGNTWEIIQNQFPAAGERIRSLSAKDCWVVIDRNQTWPI